MCGIAGRVNSEKNRPVDSALLAEATRQMAHRGPDGEGLYFQENVGLGHRRLAIIDLTSGAQPMCNEDQTIWVVFNGEIYNHQYLREQLEVRGHCFTTKSDTEILVHGFEEWGNSLPERLRGMFAFAVWDGKNRRLMLARDRLGIKPLYWSITTKDLVFASEIKALFVFPDVRRDLNPTNLPEYFALRYVPGPQTLFAGIYRLRPGHVMWYQDGNIQIRPYWDVPIEQSIEQSLDKRQIWDTVEESEAFTQELLESVRLRLMSEVPVGVFLSGGIDSTAVAWAMQQAEPGALKSFSVGFDQDDQGELSFARIASQALGTEHREIRLDSNSFLQSMEKLAWHLDEPLSDGACIPLMRLSERAREEVAVVLSGEGADEILAGYSIYSKMLAMEWLRAKGGKHLDWLLHHSLKASKNVKFSRYVHWLRLPLEQRYFGVGRGFDDALMKKIFGCRAMKDLAHRYQPLWENTQENTALHRMLYIDTKTWLPDDLLLKADKMTMSHSIELRVPFLDHQILHSAWRLPSQLKLRRGIGKILLRHSMANKIPKAILRRPKKGFPVPLSRWLRTSLYGPCREQLLSHRSQARTILGGTIIRQLLDEHRTGRIDRSEELYSLWVLEEWHRAFLGAQKISARSSKAENHFVPAESSNAI